MKKFLKEYFNFGKAESIAIFFILLLILFLILLPRIYSSRAQAGLTDASEFQQEIAEFRKLQESQPAGEQGGFDYNNPDKSVARAIFRPFLFDPNTLDSDGWVKLGFTEKQAAGILKFREKGGRFRDKEDLKKLYAVTEEVYDLLEPYIDIPAQSLPSTETKTEKKGTYPSETPSKYNPTLNQVELNTADSAALVKVYGIGPATARRIMKYRAKLGGFTHVEQLQEVYSIDSARFSGIRRQVFADASLITKININTTSLEEMRKHPYIDYYIAKAIVDKRIKNGAYHSPDEIRSIALIYDELYLKLRPYLTTDPQ